MSGKDVLICLKHVLNVGHRKMSDYISLMEPIRPQFESADA